MYLRSEKGDEGTWSGVSDADIHLWQLLFFILWTLAILSKKDFYIFQVCMQDMFNVIVNGIVTNGPETGASFYENCTLNLKQDEQVNRGEDFNTHFNPWVQVDVFYGIRYFGILYTDSTFIIHCVMVLYTFFWMVVVVLGICFVKWIEFLLQCTQ